MSVLLRTSRDLHGIAPDIPWVGIAAAAALVRDSRYRRADIGALLEQAFDAEAKTWWSIGHALSGEPSASLAHTPACVANASDFGQMLAWVRLVRDWGREDVSTLVVCDDPWLFRQLQTISGVDAARPPGLLGRTVMLTLRGLAARAAAAAKFAAASWFLRDRSKESSGGPFLMVYGHPTSTSDGYDGYFGSLQMNLPALGRMLHVDCAVPRARVLASTGRSQSLHGFGSPLFALLRLPFVRWRPSRHARSGPYGWLVRRAAAHEGGTAQAAAIRWQIHCQDRWLERRRPSVVAWPWENHNWERAFVRSARRLGIRTVGYQHSVVGRQMLNYAGYSNADGAASLPDTILCSGAATREQLLHWGHDAASMRIGGAWRFQKGAAPSHQPDAPIFVALPFDGRISAEMVAAVRSCAGPGRAFLIKDHPMTPFMFMDSPGVTRTQQPLHQQSALSAVVYAATTVGLEAVLSGLPTIRYRPSERIALDILPGDVTVTVAESETLAEALDRAQVPVRIDADRIFAPVDKKRWDDVLGSDGLMDSK